MDQLADRADRRASLVGMSRLELADRLAAISVPEKQRRMCASQIWRWIYNRGVTDFDAMSDIAKDLRSDLDRHFFATASIWGWTYLA